MEVFHERRQQRAVTKREALTFQLRACASRGGVDAMVLADHRGNVIARSGRFAEADEIAAFSPFLAKPRRWRGQVRCEQGMREVAISPFQLGRRTAYLCAMGDTRRVGGAFLEAAAGVRRIMGM